MINIWVINSYNQPIGHFLNSYNHILKKRVSWFIGDMVMNMVIPSGKLTVCYGKSQCLMGKSTIHGPNDR